MLRSLFTAVSGLRAHQTMLDVVGNNIANVNTTGYKTSSAVFEDTLSQVVRNSGGPQGLSGGTNPAQVGLGVKVGGISTNFSQGATQTTGRATDVAMQGDGFFVVKQDGQSLYTRAGSFDFDANGNLVNPDGALVQGWPADKGVVNTNAPVSNLKLPIGQTVPPRGTTGITVGGNLSADAKTTDPPSVSSIDIYDSQGKPVQAAFTYTKTTTDAWHLDVTVPDPKGPNAAGVILPIKVGSADLVWDGTSMTVPALTPPAVPTLTAASLTTAGYNFTGDISLTLGTPTRPLTQYAATDTAGTVSQDGAGPGALESFSLAPDGQLIGIFSNGIRETLGQVAVASFDNPPGLEKVGGSLYRSTSNSGVAGIGVAGNGGRGTMISGALEMSNVDLAQEFTNLIIAQRGFQANTKMIAVSDEMLQDLVNLKR
jgi:flagellar hook protein FlgE